MRSSPGGGETTVITMLSCAGTPPEVGKHGNYRASSRRVWGRCVKTGLAKHGNYDASPHPGWETTVITVHSVFIVIPAITSSFECIFTCFPSSPELENTINASPVAIWGPSGQPGLPGAIPGPNAWTFCRQVLSAGCVNMESRCEKTRKIHGVL